ncbi:MAG: Nitrile hydratase beta subunit/Nitrile hydratase beta subunit [Chloroflexi bacterium]|jgi:hypothetical protein|nr:MAG: Nitrile hydratase beta subunit/Nitrile hydratase beta subunit [Chloroflexota bacterium]
MPRVHDRGGWPADQPIDRSEHVLDDWEHHIDALAFALRNKGLISVDQMRLAMESLPLDRYETLRYYEKWAVAAEAHLTSTGVVTSEELDQKMTEQQHPATSLPGQSFLNVSIDRSDPTLSDWERRIDAIAQLLASKGVVVPEELVGERVGTPLDDSETASFFEQWAAAAEAVLKQKGLVSEEELDQAMAKIEEQWREP